MLHANAALTPRQRLRMARLVVEENWPKSGPRKPSGWPGRPPTSGPSDTRPRARPAWPIAPAAHTPARKTDPATTKRIVSLRLRKRWGAVRLAAETGVAPSTAGAVLRRCRISRLSRLERRERQVVRYEHAAPGDLLHADVKKLGNIPVGGGWRFLGREQGKANRITDGGRARSR